MDKYSLFSGHRMDGSPSIHLIEAGSQYNLGETADLEKTASKEHLPEVQELVESLEPQPDRLYLLNSALGAGEYVGFNLRGDWFGEAGLTHTPPGWDDIPVWDIDGRRKAANHTEKVGSWGNLAWGFPTFYNAHRFRHHVNKDPNRAYGYILGAFWDERMKRVILVSELIRSLCAELGSLDIYDRIANGEFPDTSMGAKVPYDVCAICGNKARTPAQYCEHVKKDARAPYGMRSILPDGRMCGVKNPQPRFFDDSFVFIGAERSAKTMSNLTDQVGGQREYTQTIYPFSPGMKIAASPNYAIDSIQTGTNGQRGGGTTSENDEQASMVRKSVHDVFKPPEPDDTLEQKLSRLISGMPLSDPKEREVLRYLHQKMRAEARLKSGDLSEKEFSILDALGKKNLAALGVKNSDIAAVKDKVSLDRAKLVQKTGSTKWGDILKSIPLPSEDHLATIRVHEAKMPDLSDEQLDHLAENPGPRLRAAARLGVVLRPHEFQYAMLKGAHPEEAEHFKKEGHVFRPMPLSMDQPKYAPHAPIEDSAMKSVTASLNGSLEERSFAPTAVRIRTAKTASAPTDEIPWVQLGREHPLLDKVSSLYNEYRAGLLAHPPDWRYVPVGIPPLADLASEEKLATSAIELSKELLTLAYWPALPVG